MKLLIRQTKYELICMSNTMKIPYVFGYLVLAFYFIIRGNFLEQGLYSSDIMVMFVLVGGASYEKKYYFGEDMFQMLPLSRKQYDWMFILEKIPVQFLRAALGTLFVLPAVFVHRDFMIIPGVFWYMLYVGGWSEQLVFMTSNEKKHSKKRFFHSVVNLGVTVLYILGGLLIIDESTNIYLRFMLILIWAILIQVVCGIIRKHLMNKD